MKGITKKIREGVALYWANTRLQSAAYQAQLNLERHLKTLTKEEKATFKKWLKTYSFGK